jgi:predicted ribonuclease toxin of YeeF-YezG toxin-antitoxin module
MRRKLKKKKWRKHHSNPSRALFENVETTAVKKRKEKREKRESRQIEWKSVGHFQEEKEEGRVNVHETKKRENEKRRNWRKKENKSFGCFGNLSPSVRKGTRLSSIPPNGRDTGKRSYK